MQVELELSLPVHRSWKMDFVIECVATVIPIATKHAGVRHGVKNQGFETPIIFER